jgi:predicted nucleic acid-binding protein
MLQLCLHGVLVKLIPMLSRCSRRCLENESSPPAHFALEATNGLIIAQRRSRISAADVSKAVVLVQNLPLELDPLTERATRETIALARLHGPTAYDAAYLELCSREGLPMASLDQALNEARDKIGVERFLFDTTT